MDTYPAASGGGVGGAVAPLLLRNFVASSIVSADHSLLNLAEKYNLHQIYRLLLLCQKLLISSFLFFLGFLPDFFSSFAVFLETCALNLHKPSSKGGVVVGGVGGLYAPASVSDASPIARALSHLLVILNDIPVGSRKYDVVRSLAERLIDENHREGFEPLQEVNRRVLSAAFDRTLLHLESAAAAQERVRGVAAQCPAWSTLGVGPIDLCLGRGLRVGRAVAEVVRVMFSRPVPWRCEYSAEKLAAELLWLAQKMAVCGIVEEAVERWALASNLGSLGLAAEPRLQASLVKLSAVLIKCANKTMEAEFDDSKKDDAQRRIKVSLLLSWLPLLCRASNGAESPVLSCGDKAELERVLEKMIGSFSEEEQERVLSLWLHHFTRCSDSDWPNLRPSFVQWCSTSRKLFIFKCEE